MEEAQRLFRNSDFQGIVEDETGIRFEEFGLPRIMGILKAVNAREKRRLVKRYNPVPGEELSFDFSSCKGTAEE
jgi:hypothetical protein